MAAKKKTTKKSLKRPGPATKSSSPAKKKSNSVPEPKKPAVKKAVKGAKKVAKKAMKQAKAVGTALAAQTAALLKPQSKTVYEFEYRWSDAKPPS